MTLTQSPAEHARQKAEVRALRMLRNGDPAKVVTAATGLTADELTALLRDFPAGTDGCPLHGCGKPQRGAGRPRHGWVQTKEAGCTPVWFCSWQCVARHAHRRAA